MDRPARSADRPTPAATRAKALLRRPAFLRGAVLVIALLVRAGWTIHNRGLLDTDPDAYVELARNLAEHGTFAFDADGRGGRELRPTAYRAPLYPVVLAPILATGVGSAGIAALHILLGLATVWLTIALGRRLGLGGWSRLAGLLVAVDPLLVHHAVQPWSEPLFTLLVALLLWLAAREGRSYEAKAAPYSPPYEGGVGGGDGRGKWLRRLAIGATFGAAALCRPTIWAFAVVAVCWWVGAEWLRWRRSGTGDETASRLQTATTAVVVALGAACVLGPWVVRNAIVFGRPILTTTHGGYTLFLANNDVFYDEVLGASSAWSGDSLREWQQHWQRRTQALDEVARDRFFYRAAWETIGRRPGDFAASVAYRLGRLWGVRPQLTDNPAASGRGGVVRSGVAVFYAVELLLVTVALLGSRTWSHPWLWLPLLLVSFSLVHALYWTDLRMRAPLVPACALLAAGAVQWLAARRRSGSCVAARPRSADRLL